MHSYGKDFRLTPHVHVLIAVLALGLFEGLRSITHLPVLKVLPVVGTVSISPLITLTLFGALEYLFDQRIWKLLSRSRATGIFDFTGVYRGRIRSADGREYSAELRIQQSWSRIVIDFKSGPAGSKSFSASIIRDRHASGDVEIIYNYFAPGTSSSTGRVDTHHGTAMLKRSSDGKDLEGEYFTEPSRHSSGTIAVSRI